MLHWKRISNALWHVAHILYGLKKILTCLDPVLAINTFRDKNDHTVWKQVWTVHYPISSQSTPNRKDHSLYRCLISPRSTNLSITFNNLYNYANSSLLNNFGAFYSSNWIYGTFHVRLDFSFGATHVHFTYHRIPCSSCT